MSKNVKPVTPGSDPSNHDAEGGVAVEEKTALKTKKPALYKILLHNDHFTTMEFVIAILESVFHKSQNDAVTIMLHVHNNGVGVAGVYTYEIAETMVAKVMSLAKEAQFPLLCTLEPDDPVHPE